MQQAVAEWFLRAVFGEWVADDARIVVFSLPGKVVAFCASVEDAVAAAERMDADDQNVYCGVGLYRADVKHGRGKAADVVAIPALWADVDFGPLHSKNRIPASQKQAKNIIERIGARPSLIVHSGHGLQPWWLLTEPVRAGDGAAGLARRWALTVAAHAQSLDHVVDSVPDVSRVLRIPGTRNLKADPVDVTLLDRPKHIVRWDADELDGWCVAEEYASPKAVTRIDAVLLAAGREPPVEKLNALLENVPKFKRTWRMARDDLTSPSEYDASLAWYAVHAGWSDQDAADLIYAFRARHGLDTEKLGSKRPLPPPLSHVRVDYVTREIGRVRAEMSGSGAVAELGKVSQSADDPPDDEERAGVLKTLSKVFDAPVTSWIQHGREQPNYVLEVDGLDVAIGGADAVLSQTTFRSRLYGATGRVLKRYKAAQWDQICRALHRIAVIVENPESSRAGQLRGWLDQYLEERRPLEGDEWSEAVTQNAPFVRDDALHVHAGSLKRHIRHAAEERIDRAHLWELLRAGGFEQTSVSVRVNGHVTSRSYWKRPGKDDR